MATTKILGSEITALSASFASTSSYVVGTVVSASYALTASYAPSSSPFPYTGSATISGSLGVTGLINNTIASNSNLGITQSLTESYSAGTQFVANGFYPAFITGSVSHDYSSGSAIVRSGVTKGNAYVSGLGVTIPQEIAGMNVVAGTDYAAISTQYQGSGTPGTQVLLTNVDGGNFQTSFNMDNATANPSMQMKIYDSQSKYHQLSISKGDPGFTFTNTMVNPTMSLFSISNSSSVALFSVFQDKKIQVDSSLTITGSLRGQVSALTISSNTASLDLSTNNFFTLALVNGTNTHINPTNINPGQTVNIRVTQGSAGTGTVSFPSFVDQASGSLYTGSMSADAIDIVTMITFDSTTVFLSSIRNMR